MTEVRRDGKDDAVISKVIAAELDRRLGGQTEDKKKVSVTSVLAHSAIN